MDVESHGYQTLIFKIVNIWLNEALEGNAIDHQLLVNWAKYFEK